MKPLLQEIFPVDFAAKINLFPEVFANLEAIGFTVVIAIVRWTEDLPPSLGEELGAELWAVQAGHFDDVSYHGAHQCDWVDIPVENRAEFKRLGGTVCNRMATLPGFQALFFHVPADTLATAIRTLKSGLERRSILATSEIWHCEAALRLIQYHPPTAEVSGREGE